MLYYSCVPLLGKTAVLSICTSVSFICFVFYLCLLLMSSQVYIACLVDYYSVDKMKVFFQYFTLFFASVLFDRVEHQFNKNSI